MLFLYYYLKIHFLSNNYPKKIYFNLLPVVNLLSLSDDMTDEVSRHQV